MPSTKHLLELNLRRSAEAIESYGMQPNRCLNCDKPILHNQKFRLSYTKKRRFCDQACAASFNNGKYPKRAPEGHCSYCQAPTRTSRRYCSALCKGRFSYEARKDIERASGGEYVVSWRRRAKIKAIAHFGGCCLRCGYTACIRSLQFHHKDPSQKDFTISGKSVSWGRILQELEKCVLLCANCHGEIHAGMWTLDSIPTLALT